MSHPEEYDVLVLGSGAAGKLLAWTLASQGRRTAVVERRYVGGSCPNIACLPSKNVGFTAFAAEAGEVMAVTQVAMLAGLPYTALRDAILTHPTMAEGLAALFASVDHFTGHRFDPAASAAAGAA